MPCSWYASTVFQDRFNMSHNKELWLKVPLAIKNYVSWGATSISPFVTPTSSKYELLLPPMRPGRRAPRLPGNESRSRLTWRDNQIQKKIMLTFPAFAWPISSLMTRRGGQPRGWLVEGWDRNIIDYDNYKRQNSSVWEGEQHECGKSTRAPALAP